MLLRRILSTLAIAGLLGCCMLLPAQNPDRPLDQLRTLSREELDVVKVLNAQERAWNKGDLDSYVSGYKNSPDTLFFALEINRGYDNILANYKRNYATRDAMGTLSFADLEPHVLDEHFAVVLGKYHLDRAKKFGGASDGLFSVIFEKTDQGWKIVVAHTN
jgi:ketosteroid isomerase-like protein